MVNGKPLNHPSLDPDPDIGPLVGGSETYTLVSAARWAGFRHFAEFDALESDEQALIVAEYRTARRLDAVLAGMRMHPRKKAPFRPTRRR